MITKLPVRVQDWLSALRALFNELCSAKDAKALPLQDVREISALGT